MPRKGMRTIFFKPPPSDSLARPATSMHGDPFADALMAERIASVEPLIQKWAVDPSNLESSRRAGATYLFRQGRREAELYLSRIKELHSAMLRCVGDDSSSGVIVRAHELLQTAVRRLSVEFHQILSSYLPYPNHAESVSSGSSGNSTLSSFSDFDYESEDEISKKQSAAAEPVMREEERAPNAAVSDLKAIAECMITCGYGKECVEVYKIVRRSVVDEELFLLGFERLVDPWRVQKMDWKVLEVKVQRWLSAAKAAVQMLFYGERILCDRVFAATSALVRDSVFSHVAQDAAVALFRFTEGAAKAIKRSPERIFRLLDLYEALTNLWPDIKSTFSSAATSAVRSLAINSLIKLGEAVRMTLGNFEAAIQKDSSKQSPVPSGGIHPLTLYVMSYLTSLADYGGVLTGILAGWPVGGSPKHPGFPDSYLAGRCNSTAPIAAGDSGASAMSARLVLVLLCKLDAKAKRYKDVALSYLFLANNLQYVVNKAAQSSLRQLLGDHWVAEHESKVKLYASNYERMGWSKVIAPLAGPRVEISSGQAKESMRKFGAALEEVRTKQAGWAVPDQKLRDEIASSLAEKLVPSYRRLYDGCPGGDPAVKFTPDDLDNYLAGMLRATGGGSGTVSAAPSLSSSRWPSPVWQGKGGC
ncbi:hypothetical protein BT93_J1355 [Corymbia citriodora subsp. variegata]|nr:hypothetical protein BT93_J1355 [Corymbia citriodora subsp. variegata]